MNTYSNDLRQYFGQQPNVSFSEHPDLLGFAEYLNKTYGTNKIHSNVLHIVHIGSKNITQNQHVNAISNEKVNPLDILKSKPLLQKQKDNIYVKRVFGSEYNSFGDG